MAHVRPFRALRYDVARVGSLANVVCPPYDVISPAEQRQLADRSPYNAVYLELGPGQPADPGRSDRYTRAAQTLRAWLAEGILAEERQEALYVYEQTFRHRGQMLTRRTIFAAVRLAEWDERIILPHERTLAAPKADRLRLLEATGVQISPVYGLFEDPNHIVHRAFDDYTMQKPAIDDFFWPDEERQRCWVVTDRDLIDTFVDALTDRPIVIADGHHRYETALHYRAIRRRETSRTSVDAPWNWIMMGLTTIDDPGLVILPTHRLVGGIPFAPQALERGLAHWFDIERFPCSPDQAIAETRRLLSRLAELGSEFHVFGLGERGERLALARLRDPDAMEEMAEPGHSAVWKQLDVAIAQTLIIHGVLGIGPEETGALLEYTRDEASALEALRSGRAWLAVFLNPPRVEQVVAVARAGDLMPEKSTYFYPKLLTGIAFYPVW